jgi:alanyl-tRNA synthetase
MTERLYLTDARLLEFDASVVRRLEHEGRPAVVLDRTAFYAESGGQPWDEGSLGEARVLSVIEHDGEVVHVLDRPLPGDTVHGRVEAARRLDHVQQHHGQHLLSKAFVEVARAETIAFHLGSEVTTIDLDRPVTADQAQAAALRANEVVWQGRPVEVVTLSVQQARAEGLKPPEGVTGEVRVVDAVGYDRQPCGGTHPRSTAEVGVILVVSLERYKVGTRVSFVCGRRALAAATLWRHALDELTGLLSAPLGELATTARKLKEDLQEGERRSKALLERAIDGDARRLLAEAQGAGPTPTSATPVVVSVVLDGWAPNDLRLLAQRLAAIAPCVALLGSRAEGKAHLVFAQSDGLGHDIPALLRQAVEHLGGRGGGRGNLAQGGGDRVEALEEALSRAAAAVEA